VAGPGKDKLPLIAGTSQAKTNMFKSRQEVAKADCGAQALHSHRGIKQLIISMGIGF